MQLNGKPWYCLQYGYYPDRDVAIEALNNLKGEVLEFQPWLRGMKSAKDAIQTADKILN
jgi:septal ring-binding cell division protein DamX